MHIFVVYVHASCFSFSTAFKRYLNSYIIQAYEKRKMFLFEKCRVAS